MFKTILSPPLGVLLNGIGKIIHFSDHFYLLPTQGKRHEKCRCSSQRSRKLWIQGECVIFVSPAFSNLYCFATASLKFDLDIGSGTSYQRPRKLWIDVVLFFLATPKTIGSWFYSFFACHCLPILVFRPAGSFWTLRLMASKEQWRS